MISPSPSSRGSFNGELQLIVLVAASPVRVNVTEHIRTISSVSLTVKAAGEIDTAFSPKVSGILSHVAYQ